MLETTATELPRLMHCIGSYYMPASLPPDIDKDARDEGNAAHATAKMLFNGQHVEPGMKVYGTFILTDDMLDHVKSYIGNLDCGDVEIETSFEGHGFRINGRADHIKYRPELSLLTIDELKYGFRLIEPENNWTLIAHALGWCIRNNVAPNTISFRVHQPRPYHPDGFLREHRITYVELMDLYTRISQRLGAPTDELTTDPDVCRKCRALPKCSAARKASMNAIDVMTAAYVDDLPNDMLAYEYELLLRASDTIGNRLNALKELMSHKIGNGDVIENYDLEPRYAHRKWNTGLTASALKVLTGIDLAKDGIVTPAEAERRGVPEEVVAAFTNRPMIDQKLKRIDPDKKARKIFGGG